MAGRKYDDKMHLDMPFGEALTRFIGTNPAEMQDNITKSKKKRPPGGKKRKPSDSLVKSQNVVRLRDKRSDR